MIMRCFNSLKSNLIWLFFGVIYDPKGRLSGSQDSNNCWLVHHFDLDWNSTVPFSINTQGQVTLDNNYTMCL